MKPIFGRFFFFFFFGGGGGGDFIATLVYMPLRGIVVIVVSALAWNSLGQEIKSCPRVRECFPLNTL